MKRTAITGILILIPILLAACGGSSAPQAATEPAAALPTESQPAQIPATESAPTNIPPAETAIPATEAAQSASISYANDIAPILNQSCVNCHGGEFTREGLDMTTYDLLMKGSFGGAVIIPGDAMSSPLIQLVSAGKMPKRGTKLTPEQIQLITDWVNSGALNN